MNKFAKLNTARQLTDSEMLELRGGELSGCTSCKKACLDGCLSACKNDNKNQGNGNTGTISPTVTATR